MILIAVIPGVSCSDDSASPAEPAPEPQAIESFPLRQGAVWEYSFLMYETDTRFDGAVSRTTLRRSFGSLTLSVPRETPTAFDRSYQLDSELTIDSAHVEEHTAGVADTFYLLTDRATHPRTWSIFFHNDTLWYMDGGERRYMMPARFVPGGTVDLRLFNPPGIDLLTPPMSYSRRWATGDLIFRRDDAELKSAARLDEGRGVRSVWARSRTVDGDRSLHERVRELEYDLLKAPEPPGAI